MSLKLNEVIINSPQGPLCSPIDLDIRAGEIVALMGPSGCGKSTLLSAIAGHLSSYFSLHGDITLDGDSLLSLPTHKRHVGILFQDDLLFPHLNIWQNLAFGLDASIKNTERKEKALLVLEQIALSEHSEKMPEQLSGGQRARISLMRTLLSKPKALLLDEPFSKLDAELRFSFRQFVCEHIKEAQIPTLMVTHDAHDVAKDNRILTWPYASKEYNNA